MKKALLALTLCSIFILSSVYLAVGQQPPIYPISPFLEKQIFEKWLELKELSAAPSHSSGYGKLYVLAADGKLYYKDDAGNATDLTAGGGGGAHAASHELLGADLVDHDNLTNFAAAEHRDVRAESFSADLVTSFSRRHRLSSMMSRSTST